MYQIGQGPVERPIVDRMPLDRQSLDILRARFGLGEILAPPTPVAGGMLHRMVRLDASTGSYALKLLNPEIVARPGVRNAYVRSERFARALAIAGLPAIAALDPGDGPLVETPAGTALLFPWIDGEMLDQSAVAPARAERVGALLAAIHAQNHPPGGFDPPDWQLAPDAAILALVEAGERQGVPWAPDLRADLPELAAWRAAYESAVPLLRSPLVVSHRDIHQGNLLWRGDRPFLIDWESAGLVNPSLEILGTAFWLACITIGDPARDTVIATFRGYRNAGGALPANPRAILPSLFKETIGWLVYNLRRSVEPGFPPGERALGISEALATLPTLHRIAAGLDTWPTWIVDATS
jgi:aminoglycoside phosphotransferase (APT) family kinase protein